jgi:cytochrome c peroxidase
MGPHLHAHSLSIALGALTLAACVEEPRLTVGPVETPPAAAEAGVAFGTAQSALLSLEAQLGKAIFTDKNLSTPAGQSCASCHTATSGFADPDSYYPTSEGVIAGRFGPRNSPTAAYALYSPALHYDAVDGTYVGGLFWDGRVDNLEEQAKGPFLNPLEMNNRDKAAVVNKVRVSPYASLFLTVYGPVSLLNTDSAYNLIAKAIATYERTAEFKPFSSKYDAYLAGKATLTTQEANGLRLYEDPAKGNCAACHPSRPTSDGPPLFTDFTYDNIGVPRNPSSGFFAQSSSYNPAGAEFVDMGLGAAVKDPAHNGKFKVPTLRNIARTAPYMHNGLFKDLRSVVSFYNARDLGGFAPPELPATVNHDELGNLHLTGTEIDAIVAFQKTLNDGY